MAQQNEAQIKDWVEGVWRHDPETDHCTPDFGCCHPELKELWPTVRQLYVNRPDVGRCMDVAFIAKLFDHLGWRV